MASICLGLNELKINLLSVSGTACPAVGSQSAMVATPCGRHRAWKAAMRPCSVIAVCSRRHQSTACAAHNCLVARRLTSYLRATTRRIMGALTWTPPSSVCTTTAMCTRAHGLPSRPPRPRRIALIDTRGMGLSQQLPSTLYRTVQQHWLAKSLHSKKTNVE